MTNLLLIARNPSLSFGLGAAADEIIEVRPALVGKLDISPGMADVVVIEQEFPADAVATLDLLRENGLVAPALLVASKRVEWDEFDPGSRPSVAVLDPPITQDRLGSSVGTARSLPNVGQVTGSDAGGAEDSGPAERTSLRIEATIEVAPEPASEATLAAAVIPAATHAAKPRDSGKPASKARRFGRRAKSAQTVEEAVVARAAALEVSASEESRLAEEARQTEEDRLIEVARLAAVARAADEARLAEVARLAEETRLAEEEGASEETRLAEEARLEQERAAEQARLAEETRLEQERLAEQARREEARLEQERLVTEETRLAEEARAVEEARLEQERASERARLAEAASLAAIPDTVDDLEPADEPYATATHTDATSPGISEAEDGQETLVATPVAPSARPPTKRKRTRAVAAKAAGGTTKVEAETETEEALLIDSPSPSSWEPHDTEPVVVALPATSEVLERPSTVADQPVEQPSQLAQGSSVYEEMASLRFASVELMADDTATTVGDQRSSPGPEPTIDELNSRDETPTVDLSQVFRESGTRPHVKLTPHPLASQVTDAVHPEVPELDPPAVPMTHFDASGPTPMPTSVSVVDLRDSMPDDPRSTPALVRALLGRSHEVYGVIEAGSLVVSDALARTNATAGALLLPDGDVWRVSAGEGLRRLEHRFVLQGDAWLVTTIASRHKGVIIDRTDLARLPLAGAPLASHKHLVAAPVRAVGGILLIARDDDPAFAERDLLSLARLAEASADILAAALDARQLSRLLADLRDQDDRTAADRIDYGL